MSAAAARWSLALACLIAQGACPAPRGPEAGGAAEAAGAAKEPPRPRWDDPAAVPQFWPQAGGLAEGRMLRPFLYQRGTQDTPSLTATYDPDEHHTGPYAMHLQFQPLTGANCGFGVTFLRSYDAGLYSYLTFWVKGRHGQRFRIQLKDASGLEVYAEYNVREELWQRAWIPLSDFKGINAKALSSLTFEFKEPLGEADIYLDDLEFATR